MFKINLVAGLLLFLAGFSVVAFFVKRSDMPNYQVSTEQIAQPQDTGLAWLKAEEDSLWEELKNKYHLEQNEIEQSLGSSVADVKELQAIRQMHGTGNTLPSDVLSLAQEVIKDVGLNQNELVLLEIKKSLPPAGTVYNIVMINPVEFSKYTRASQKFIIAHELVHYRHQDDAVIGILKGTLKPSKEQLNDPDYIINRISRFHEIRADLKAAQNGPDYAQGLIEYMQHQIGKKTEQVSITHPTYEARLAFGQSSIHKSYGLA